MSKKAKNACEKRDRESERERARESSVTSFDQTSVQRGKTEEGRERA